MNNSINDKKIDIIIKTILVIIIIILLLHNCYISKKNKNEKTPTGNIEIIEIKCDKDDVCEIENNKENNNKTDNTNNNQIDDKSVDITENTNNNRLNNNKKNNEEYERLNDINKNDDKPNDTNNNDENNKEKTQPVDVEPDEPVEEELVIKDKNIKWNDSTNAKIFTNSMYQLSDIIAPESYNTYQFIVKNGTKYNLKYNIDFIEDNPYNINMKYKLKKNDTYLVDHYVSASELNISDFMLDSKTTDTYYLEWKWISSSNDTEIGSNPNSKYELKIDIKAESYND